MSFDVDEDKINCLEMKSVSLFFVFVLGFKLVLNTFFKKILIQIKQIKCTLNKCNLIKHIQINNKAQLIINIHTKHRIYNKHTT